MDRTANTPITDAVYGKKAAHKKPPAKQVRKPRTTSVGESITPHAAAALVALRAELEAWHAAEAGPKKRRRRAPKKAS